MSEIDPTPSAAELIAPAQGIYNILEGTSSFNLPSDSWYFGYGRMTPEPDEQLVVLGSTGKAGEIAVAVDYPGVQLLCRGKAAAGSYATTRAVLVAARNVLVAIPSAPSLWPNLTMCVERGSIQDLGFDDQNRPMFSLNLQLTVSYATSGYRD